jgi:nucleotide-binding universal stress UspA family protein
VAKRLVARACDALPRLHDSQTMQPKAAVPDSFAFATNELFRRILVPIDFYESSRRALALAFEFRERYGSEIHLFHLTESSENDRFLAGVGAHENAPGLAGEAEGRLQRFVENVFPGRSREVLVHARVGNEVAQDVVNTADKVGATLVILGAEARQTILRTNAERIIKGLHASVLLIRVPRESTPGEVLT